MLIVTALAVAIGAGQAEERLARMTALFDSVCLRAFPDDGAVAALMAAAKATPLTAEAIRVTMRDDPARAWDLHDGGATVWLEFPPFHACSVRWNVAALGPLPAYREVADRYELAAGGFRPITPFDSDQGPIHVHAVGEQRQAAGGSDALFVFDQHVTDQARRDSGETGFSLRFVHQLAPPTPPAK